MSFDAEYLAVVFNSTLRQMTPILYVALGSVFCNRVYIFNIGLEGMMLTGAFFAIVANYYTGSVFMSLIVAMISSMTIAFIAGIFMVKFHGAMLVVGIAINVLMSGLTTFLMQVIFGLKGAFVSTDLKSLPKINTDFLSSFPILKLMFNSLTYLDLFAFILAVILYLVLFKTVVGLRIRSVGINAEAVESFGISSDYIKISMIVFSGLLSGVAGCLLTMSGVTMFAENITAGRGFIAMAAGALGGAHPLGVVVSSAFFGFAQSLGNMLQNSKLGAELTMSFPYLATIIGLVFYNYFTQKREKKFFK